MKNPDSTVAVPGALVTLLEKAAPASMDGRSSQNAEPKSDRAKLRGSTPTTRDEFVHRMAQDSEFAALVYSSKALEQTLPLLLQELNSAKANSPPPPPNGNPPPEMRGPSERRKHHLRRMTHDLAYRQRVDGGELSYEPRSQPVFNSSDGTNRNQASPIEHHDILVVAPKGVHGRRNHFRVPVRKVLDQPDAPSSELDNPRAAHGRIGAYDKPPELIGAYDTAERAFEMLARPHDWGPAAFRKTERGPAFATIPVKPEPGGSDCAICYMVNTQNLNYRNAWTAEEWSDVPDGPDLPPTRNVDATSMEVLLAGPRGLVFRLSVINLDEFLPGDRIQLMIPRDNPVEAGSLTCIDLAPQMEIWQQLRSGCVMGRALFDSDGTKRVVPLVNITSLMAE